MKVGNNAPLQPALQHVVGFYASETHLVAQITGLIRAARDRGEPVVLGVHTYTWEAVGEALGCLTGVLPLVHPEGPEGRSGQTLVASRARELRRLIAESGPATVITQHRSGFDGPDGRFWTELDAAVNIALWDLPVQATCFFPEMPTHRAVLHGARRNHPMVLVGDELHYNPDHRRPYDVLAESPVPPPPDLGPPDMRMTFDGWQLREVRAMIERSMLGANYDRERAEDVSLAVNEVATNAVEHGAGESHICVWSGAREYVFEVHDRGVLAELLPGLRPPHPAERRRRGLWIARQLCDSLHVWADATGTHVRIHAAA